MGKAKQRTLEAYPMVMSQYSDNCKEYDSNESDRLTFIEGYHQAEKDSELTWKDMKSIYEISCDVFNEQDGCFYDVSEIWKEALRRFKERKEQ